MSELSAVSSAVNQANTADAVSMLMLKQSLDIQSQSAFQLIQALPPVPNNPPNLGSNVDVFA